jgi:uncharacterized membrane protein HdeD (DUF308 family)
MKVKRGIFPIFKALMAIVYLLLGAAILVYPKFLLPDYNSVSIVFGIVLIMYGLIRAYTSFVDYSSILKEKRDEEL